VVGIKIQKRFLVWKQIQKPNETRIRKESQIDRGETDKNAANIFQKNLSVLNGDYASWVSPFLVFPFTRSFPSQPHV
jgi:hypothetical protein